MSKETIDKYWAELAKTGKEVLELGTNSGFGMSLVEVKWQNGEPAVMVKSHSTSIKFADNQSTKEGIVRLMDTCEAEQFDGTRTMTFVYQKGKVNRILVDDYQNVLLTPQK